MTTEESDVGYGKPPKETRFAKGQSGNPKGRPPGTTKSLPYDTVLGQKVTIREDGIERQVTAAEAFLLHLAKRGLAGDGPAGRAAMAAIEDARSRRVAPEASVRQVVFVPVAPGAVGNALQPLKMGVKLDRFGVGSRMMLEPWLVQLPLDRLGERQLTSHEQAEVVAATRTPKKVHWPDWWVAAV